MEAVLAAIQEGLKDSGEVRLVGFGTFETVKRKASTGRNPRTGEQIEIAESTSVKFKAGKALKDAVG
ncbi:DNA-binding protein HU-beta (fragment) [Rhodovastum atsumiense]